MGNFGSKGEFPPDQRSADGECLAFTSAPVTEPCTFLGNPEVDLELAVDRPDALVAVRLCDVAPDGASVLVTWGLLNLTHRDSHEHPAPLKPGQRYRVTVQLRMMGYQLAAGHRWRIGISPTFTRHAWPSKEMVQLSLFTGEACRVRLPVRAMQAADRKLPDFPPAKYRHRWLSPGRAHPALHTVTHDQVDGWIAMKLVNDEGRIRFLDNGLETATAARKLQGAPGNPLSVSQHFHTVIEFQRGDWRVRVETASLITADATISIFPTTWTPGREWPGTTDPGQSNSPRPRVAATCDAYANLCPRCPARPPTGNACSRYWR